MAPFRKYHDAPEAVASHDPEAVRSYDAPEALSPKVHFITNSNVSSDDQVLMPKDGHSGTIPKRLGDMKASRFWLILGIVCFVVVGAIVGGVVGGTMAGKKSNDSVATGTSSSTSSSTNLPTTSPTPTTTSSSSLTTSTKSTSTSTPSFIPTTDCTTSTNNTVYTSLYSTGASGQVPSGSGLSFKKLCGISGTGDKVGSAFVYTYEDCIEVCAGYNFWAGNRVCKAATFKPTGIRPTNCWAHVGSSFSVDASIDSAILV